ncbi:MAG: HAD family hydrolase [Methanomicrobiaceae archaeon]|nr:HAD family hydrolase [Methanomicrobiaceae archaeon]
MPVLEGVKGILFDCYDTLIEIRRDEEDIAAYEALSAWLRYQGVSIDPSAIRDEYRTRIRRTMDQRKEKYPEVRLEEIFRGICADYRLWEIDEMIVGIQAARAFRAASLRRFRAFPETVRLLDHLGYVAKGIVSNGQRVFSEIELKYLGLHHHFDVIVFSSDIGVKKPDPRIFRVALDALSLEPEEALFIGDSFEADILGARKVGMQAMFIREAWTIPDRSYTEYLYARR